MHAEQEKLSFFAMKEVFRETFRHRRYGIRIQGMDNFEANGFVDLRDNAIARRFKVNTSASQKHD